MRFNIISYIAIIFFALGCSESEIPSDSNRLGLNYFPLEVGNYRIYDVIEKNYSVLGVMEGIYELKESVVDSSLNSGGNLFYTIHRSTRLNSTEEWKLDSIWTAQRNKSIGILVENNVPFVKLSFPIEDAKVWDGNSQNTLSREDYFLNAQITDSTINEVTYSKLIKVIQSDQGEDILGIENRSEIYAPDIGLLIKVSTVLKYCQLTCDCSLQCEGDQVVIVAGREFHMTLKEHGKE